jgi:hypothetical protein
MYISEWETPIKEGEKAIPLFSFAQSQRSVIGRADVGITTTVASVVQRAIALPDESQTASKTPEVVLYVATSSASGSRQTLASQSLPAVTKKDPRGEKATV